jgi:phosphoribosylamine---glycine ligase
MDKVLLVGNGAREHAIAEAICRSPGKPQLYAYMSKKNPGIARLSKEYAIGDILDAKEIAAWAKEKKISLAIVGPEAPLDAGVVDALEKEGIDCASPCREAARLETDKAFSRDLLKRHNVPGAPIFKILVSEEEIDEFVDSVSMDLVVKPAGLTGGKGVKIEGEHLKNKEEVKDYAKEILQEGIGDIDMVVIEEKLVGEEFTLQAFVSPDEILGMPMVQDHKRAYDGDRGPNTGGMGSYTGDGYILPFLKKEDYDFGLNVIRESVKALKKETGKIYKGPIYCQMIVTQNGPKLIEFNARFGDPEAMNVLSLFEGDFVEVMKAMVHGGLEKASCSFAAKASVCKYLVPSGYPDNPESGAEIRIDEEAVSKAGAHVHYAAVSEENGKIFTSSSRAVSLTGLGTTIEAAEKIAEKATRFVKGPLEHRKDIGTEELIQKRFSHMRQIRGQ